MTWKKITLYTCDYEACAAKEETSVDDPHIPKSWYEAKAGRWALPFQFHSLDCLYKFFREQEERLLYTNK